MSDDKGIKSWFDRQVLKALAWFCVLTLPIAIPTALYLGEKYVELNVKIATIEATAIKADDMKALRDDIRHAIRDGNQAIADRLKSDEDRIGSLENRK